MVYADEYGDFVAMRSRSVEYFQVTNSTLPEDVHDQELRPLRIIRDSFLIDSHVHGQVPGAPLQRNHP